MYFVLTYCGPKAWFGDPFESLEDEELDSIIKEIKNHQGNVLSIHHSGADAMAFAHLFESMCDTYFAGDMEAAFVDFRTYLYAFRLEILPQLEQIRKLPLAQREHAVDDFLTKLARARREYQADLLEQFNQGNTSSTP